MFLHMSRPYVRPGTSRRNPTAPTRLAATHGPVPTPPGPTGPACGAAAYRRPEHVGVATDRRVGCERTGGWGTERANREQTRADEDELP
jgi:hypothetical protein